MLCTLAARTALCGQKVEQAHFSSYLQGIRAAIWLSRVLLHGLKTRSQDKYLQKPWTHSDWTLWPGERRPTLARKLRVLRFKFKISWGTLEDSYTSERKRFPRIDSTMRGPPCAFFSMSTSPCLGLGRLMIWPTIRFCHDLGDLVVKGVDAIYRLFIWSVRLSNSLCRPCQQRAWAIEIERYGEHRCYRDFSRYMRGLEAQQTLAVQVQLVNDRTAFVRSLQKNMGILGLPCCRLGTCAYEEIIHTSSLWCRGLAASPDQRVSL